MQPLVSVILVSYNTSNFTLKSIKSISSSRGFSAQEIEIILIDNNSSDDTVTAVRRGFPQVQVVANKKNQGFGAGNNQGASLAKGQYLLFLNTDAFLEADTLSHLVNILKERGELSSVAPQLRYSDGTLQQSAGYFPTPLRVLGWMWWLDKLPGIKKLFSTPYHVYDLNWYKHAQYPDWLMGACVLLRAEEYRLAGGFDEKIFMYGEEVELYFRLLQVTGKKNYFTNGAWATHLGSASTKKASASRLVLELHGIEYFYRKHRPHLLWFIRAIIYTGVMMRRLLFSLIPSRQESAKEYGQYFQK